MTKHVGTRWYCAPELLLSCYNYGSAVDVWSASCTFAELPGRIPIFPGTAAMNLLQRIIAILRTPEEEELELVQSEHLRRFLESQRFCCGIPFSSLFPRADPWGLDLLKKMLVSDQKKSITVIEALQHPHLAGLYDPAVDIPAQFPVETCLSYLTEENTIREKIWQEMLHYQ